jgi:hypothetical protein
LLVGGVGHWCGWFSHRQLVAGQRAGCATRG